MAKKIDIGGELHSTATGNIVADANEIKYRPTGKEEKTQAQVNDELIEAVGSGGGVDARIASAVNAAKAEIKGNATSDCDTLGEAEALIASEASRAGNAETALSNRITPLEAAVGTGGSVDSRISAAVATETTRAQQAESSLSTGKADKATTLAGYGITDAYTKTEVNGLVDTPHQEYETVDAYANLPATGSKDTIYRVSNYNGSTSQVDASVYSEYAWDGSQYVFLCVKSQIGEVFDISVYNNNAKYADLDAALNGGANIPQSLQKGGMSVKFVQSSDNKYVKYFLPKDEWSANKADWEKVNLEEEVSRLGQEIYGEMGYQPLVLDLTSGYYYNQYQGKISDDLGERADTSCSRVNASPENKFKIYGRGSAIIHLYAFTDSSLNVLLTNTESVNSRSEGLEITAPANSAFLFINFIAYDSTTDKLEKYEVIQEGLEARVDELEEDLGQISIDIAEQLPQKVNKTDIVNDLISGGTTKVLSAEQGKILNEQLNGTTTIQTLTGIEDGKYYNMNGNYVNPGDVPSGVTYTCSRISADCVPGDKFKVFGYGRNQIFNLYAFTDSKNNIIEVSTYPIDTRAEGLVITCPTGATKLFVNFYNYDSATDKLQKIVVEEGIQEKLETTIEAVGELETRVEDVENYIDKQPLKNKKILAFGDSITEFKWSVNSGGDGKGWVDHAAEILGCEFVNAAIGGSHMGSRYIGHIELFDSTHQYGTDDYVFYKPSDTMNLYKCINAHSGSWDANDFEDVSENQSLIGTVAYTPIFVYSMIHSFCNTSVADAEERFRDQIAAAECIYTWKTSHDDNRAIVQALVSTDPSEIDAIIIAEGTNDYAAAGYRGTSGSFDVTTCLGGINQALKEIGETFKKIATFYVTPPVRWWNWANGSGQLADFSDNYKANGESDITLREWVEILKNEYHLRHIPTCDLYNELGWNQWNFANYFPENDGTHPRPGFKNIGAKVASFLIAHNVIK